ncbi:hypothetical protein HCN52_09430 [Streptomyces bohaiensis]|uniref:Uncharacterized protein n=1 Tax=Streptomyces bohaiensis TaxID=1431344 RepID=A0ABX1CCP1_9ACTN|nr:hypothetical protein [Streptomyces bohaiensis]
MRHAGDTPRSPAQTRVPWWALLLPAVAFAVLLALPAATTASAVGDGSAQHQPQLVSELLERVHQALLRA